MARATSGANGREDTPIVAVARHYLGCGWRPIPVPRGEKGPTRPRWQHLRIEAAELDTECLAPPKGPRPTKS